MTEVYYQKIRQLYDQLSQHMQNAAKTLSDIN
jgi:hypothetical protein